MRAHREDTIKRYSKRLAKFGYDPRSLGWNKARQTVRFTVLGEIGELQNSSVLDVGCGFGDLYGYLQKSGVNVHYTGCDVNPALIAIAKQKYTSANFLVADVDEGVKGTFDWVFATGVFEFKYPKMIDLVKRTLTRMFDLARKGVAADFMSSYVDYKSKEGFHAHPEEIFKIAKSLSKRIALRHDYMPYEFCIYIYKDNEINKRNVFSSFDMRLKQKFGTDEFFPVQES
jgi:trans-aconitate methyltransferase